MAKKTTKQEKITMHVEKRTILGKKLRKLRKEGLIPGNIYGTDFHSLSIMFPRIDFLHVYKIVKETGVIFALLEKDEIPILIKNVQKHPVTGAILHVDLRKIDLKKKIETEVPIKINGSSEAVNQKNGVLLTHFEKLKIEAYPQDIPQSINIDISVLKEIGQEIKVENLAKSTHFEIKEDPKKLIISVTAHKEEVAAPQTETVAPEITTAVPVKEGETATETPKMKTEEEKKEPQQKTEKK